MYWLRLGYWNDFGGFGQTASIYISDDFQSFMMEDWDNEKEKEIYIVDKLPEHIRYDRIVQSMIEKFIGKFSDINCVEDVENKVEGIIDFSKFSNDLPY